ncbi:conserved hypothetical protein [Leishmania braziliensis MHOM/BR/75/M2904]|uniref:Swiss Army Knife RNA repair protein HAD domain-containing protein n=2 Tax=Leishmania braziliensis TaxID=5660 RepID=A4HCX8_LEIBR|nr:conserved hypothetical protein [Leishmania braziliensis MHOM/BR/75/M2904]KAI5688542.1 hypothetical protein MNV84_04016 [Leishmania braziliensis]CAJ2473268.1 unnamed protein product [Leishmania braziliensis]CAJ2473806.1 unnamed protein product [Leishmania braziliensis]CAM36624.1 conserved hypothetical protein [Leishmania braziliensis MHOM/BR/75/M2904]SYZ66097.1 Hypothetical_protein_(DUF2410) [Leishmania braziliensis MHOM/BR/75/M2904]
MVELHIFDFDGTIFYSPVADPNALTAALVATGDLSVADAAVVANKLHGKLRSPVSSGGLGWYQSLSTLSPPAVPERPAEITWFVEPILAHMRAIVETRNSLMRQRCSTVGTQPPVPTVDMPLIYVLTGRDVKYYDRIWTLLQQAGLDKEVEDVLLKPSETAGTVKYKLNHFFSLIQYHQPARVFYYEDRVEQGRLLLEGMRALEEVLYMDVRDRDRGTVSSDNSYWKADRVGVVTFDVAGSTTEAVKREEGKWQNGCHGEAPRRCEAVTVEPPSLTVLHTPQPTVVSCADRGRDTWQGTDGRNEHLSTLVASLRASPYSLLRDACYPVHRYSLYDLPSLTETLPEAKVSTALSQAERQAQQWVEGTVRFYNSKSSFEGRGRVQGGRPVVGSTTTAFGSGAKAAAVYDPRALRAAISFAVPPPFVFIMVLVPPALCGRSSGMLSEEQLVALVRTLEEEKRAADEGRTWHRRA